MPTYVFECPSHGVTEKVLGFHDPKPELCECGEPLKRKYTPPNIIYVGSGFYTTDKVLYDYNPLDDDD